jgi:hypothetical protein
MGVVGRLLGLGIGGLVLAGALGTIPARAAKQRFVPLDDPDADEVRLGAIFDSVMFRSTAGRFRGGTLMSWYGGGVIDLRSATLDPAGARLEVQAIFGGGQILVPDDWRVTTNVRGIGGVGDARPKAERAPDAPHLTIEGIVLFGGYGIQSELSEDVAKAVDLARDRYARSRGEAAEPGGLA